MEIKNNIFTAISRYFSSECLRGSDVNVEMLYTLGVKEELKAQKSMDFAVMFEFTVEKVIKVCIKEV